MAIVAVISSPRRNGNTATIVRAIAESVRSNGKEVVIFELNGMQHKMGCQGCRACKKNGRCTFKDDVTPVLDAIRDAEGVILSSPVYMNDYCSQYRTLADRFYSFVSEPGKTINIEQGKKVAVVTSTSATGGSDLADRMERQMMRYGFTSIGKIAYVSPKGGITAKDDSEVLALAEAIGKRF